MNLLSQTLWGLSYLGMAAVAAIVLRAAAGLETASALLAGALVLLFLLFCHSTLQRRRERQEIDHRLMALYEDYQTALASVQDLQRDLDHLKAEAESGGRPNSELVSEMKVLQTLLAQVVAKSGPDRRSPPPASGAETVDAPSQPASHPEHGEARGRDEVLSIIQNALEDNRVDLYLQPIVRLPSRKPAYYEAYSRVRDAGGTVIFPREYLPLAEASGLIGTLDNLLLFRCIQVIRRLGPRRRDVRFFCNISAASLADRDFFPQFIDFMINNLELADRLVFEFSQASIRDQSKEVERSLSALGRRGFRFSMDHVTDLSLDPPTLALRHFSVVKVAADVFLTGEGDIRREDLKEVLARHDIDLVIEKIEEESQVIDILDYGVQYGQGFLFGEPRPSRDDLADGTESQF